LEILSAANSNNFFVNSDLDNYFSAAVYDPLLNNTRITNLIDYSFKWNVTDSSGSQFTNVKVFDEKIGIL
jgi:hypothetical protein